MSAGRQGMICGNGAPVASNYAGHRVSERLVAGFGISWLGVTRRTTSVSRSKGVLSKIRFLQDQVLGWVCVCVRNQQWSRSQGYVSGSVFIKGCWSMAAFTIMSQCIFGRKPSLPTVC